MSTQIECHTEATRRLVMRLIVPSPVDRVWQAWTDPGEAGMWFAAAARIVPERGEPYELFWQPDSPDHESTIGCRVTAVSPLRYLSFTWRGPDVLGPIMNEGDPPPPPTNVTVCFSPHPAETAIEVVHSGFRQGNGWDQAISWHERAWNTCLGNLSAYLAGDPLPRPWS